MLSYLTYNYQNLYSEQTQEAKADIKMANIPKAVMLSDHINSLLGFVFHLCPTHVVIINVIR